MVKIVLKETDCGGLFIPFIWVSNLSCEERIKNVLVGDFSFNLKGRLKNGEQFVIDDIKSKHCQQQDIVLLLLLAEVQFSYLLEVTLKNVLPCEKFSSIEMLVPKTWSFWKGL